MIVAPSHFRETAAAIKIPILVPKFIAAKCNSDAKKCVGKYMRFSAFSLQFEEEAALSAADAGV